MRRPLKWIALSAAIFVTVSCAIAPAKNDPGEMLQRLADAIARGDAIEASAMFADDAFVDVHAPGSLCSPVPCIGRAAIQKDVERRASVKQKTIITNTYVSGNVVTFRGELRNDAVRKAGSERVIVWGIYEVSGDKFSRAHTGIFERADSQTARFLDWQRTPASSR
jgi:hypothetical protein